MLPRVALLFPLAAISCALLSDLDSLKGTADAAAGGGGGTPDGGGASGAAGNSTGGSSTGGTSSGGSGGSVIDAGCDSGGTTCGGECVDTLSAPKHCGGCGIDCGAATCTNGICGSELVVQQRCHGLTANGTTLYFVNDGPGATATAGLYSVDIAPSAALPATPTPLATGSAYAGAAYVTAAGPDVFFTAFDSDAVIKWSPSDTTPFFQASGHAPWDIEARDGAVYWTAHGGHALQRRAASGATAAEVLLNASTFAPRHLALDGSSVFYTDDVAGKVGRYDLTTQADSPVWNNMTEPYGVDAVTSSNGPTRVAVTRRNGADVLELSSGTWTLFKLADVAPLTSGNFRGGDLQIAGEDAYWTLHVAGTAGRLMRRRLDRTSPALVLFTSDSLEAVGVTLTPTHAYFCTSADLRRIRIAL